MPATVLNPVARAPSQIEGYCLAPVYPTTTTTYLYAGSNTSLGEDKMVGASQAQLTLLDVFKDFGLPMQAIAPTALPVFMSACVAYPAHHSACRASP